MIDGEQQTNNDGAAAPAFVAPDNTADLAEIFGFELDDAGEAGDDDKGGAAKPGAAVGAGAEGEEGGDASAAPPSEPQETEEERQLRLTNAEAENKRLREELAAKAAPVKEEPKGKEAPAEPAPNDEDAFEKLAPKASGFKFSDEQKAAVFSEDPEVAGAAMEQIVGSLIDHTNQQSFLVLKAVNAAMKRIDELAKSDKAPPAGEDPAPTEQTLAEQEEAAKKMREEYYKSWPAHKGDGILPIIGAVAGEFAKKFPDHPWDKNFINSLGREVEKRVKELSSSFGKPANSQSLQPGSRSADAGAGDDDPNAPEAILDMLS